MADPVAVAETVADVSSLEGEFALFVFMGLRNRLDSIGAPRSWHERVVQPLVSNEGMHLTLSSSRSWGPDASSQRRVPSSMVGGC